MRKYWEYFKIGYQTMTVYRGQMIFGLLRHLIVVLMAVILWGIIFKNKISISGFDFRSIVTYYILVEIVDIFYSTTPARVLTRDINTGDLSNYLTKPINYWCYLLFYALGTQIGYVSFSLIFLILSFVIFPSAFFIQTSLLHILAFLLLVVVCSLIYFQIFFIVGSLTFWISETTHFRSGIKNLLGVFGGRWVPLVFFPLWAQNLLNLTPFPYLFNAIVRTYQGAVDYGQIITYFSNSIFWLLILFGVSTILWRKGQINYAAYGK